MDYNDRKAITSLPARLRSLGIEVPADLVAGIESSDWAVSSPNLDAARERLRVAQTAEEFDRAGVELAQAYALWRAMNAQEPLSGQFRANVEMTRDNRLLSSLRAVRSDLYAGLAERFEAPAKALSEALQAIPDAIPANVFELDPDTAQRLSTAGAIVGELRTILDVYNLIAGVSGEAAPAVGKSPESARVLAARLGAYESAEDMQTAADWIEAHANDRFGEHGMTPLAPFAAVVLAGGKLRLAAPSEARSALG